MTKDATKKFLTGNAWWIYFILAFLISWPVWISGDLLLPEGLRTITLVIGAFGPFCAAIILVRVTEGRSGLRHWFRTIFNFRIPLFWYLLGGILAPFIIASLHHLIYLALGGLSGVDFGPQWLGYFVYLIPTALLTGGNEEPGWRGYITPVLIRKFNIIVANVIIGVLWALWHLPMYLTGDWGGNNQPISWLIAYCIPLSVILTWLFYRSKRSIVPVMLLHAGSNVVFQYFPMESDLFSSVEDEFTLIKTIIYWTVAFIILIATKGKLGYVSSHPTR
jgi:membrane protease YdiL (CAAX protease family)